LSGQITVHGDATGWGVNDEIVIAGSEVQAYPTYVERSEARRITNVVGTGSSPPTTTFDTVVSGGTATAFTHRHVGAATAQVVTRATGSPLQWTLEERAEVGLLSHNVVVTGDPSSWPKHGAHVMLMRCPLCKSGGGRGRFSNTEFRVMGQKQALGRYPIHWHMQLDHGQGQYLKNCSIHQSSNRAVTIHGSDYVTVEDNVAYHHAGHGIFLEDGSEQHNVIRRNLVMESERPSAGEELLPSDNQFSQFQNQTPGVFWITNPNNIIEDNVATGSTGTGYWFIFPTRLLGLSYDWSDPAMGPNFLAYQTYLQPLRTDPPVKQPLGSFKGNLVHGCMSGFDVNDSIWFDTQVIGGTTFLKDSIRTNIGWAPPTATQPALLEDFTAYGCDIGIYSGTSFDETLLYYIVFGLHPFDFVRPILADNRKATMIASYVTLDGGLFMADSGKQIQIPWATLAYVYDGAFNFSNCHVDGFDFGGHTMLVPSGSATLHSSNVFANMTRSGSAPLLFNLFSQVPPPSPPPPALPLPPASSFPTPTQWGITVTDDGTATGAPGTIITNHPWLLTGLPIPGFETQLAGTGNQWRSMLEFGLVSVQFRPRQSAPAGWPGTVPPPITPVPQAVVKRLPHWALGGLSYFDDTNTTHHRGLTAIVDVPSFAPTVEYEYDWNSPPPPLPAQPPLPSTGHMSVTLDDRAPGDVAWVALRGIPFTNVFLETVTDVRAGSGTASTLTPVASFAGVTGTAAIVDAPNQLIKLRLQITSGHRHETVSVTWN
jgi:hypothetical protein